MSSPKPGESLAAGAIYVLQALDTIGRILHKINAQLGGKPPELRLLLRSILEDVRPLLPSGTVGQFLLVRGNKLQIVASTHVETEGAEFDVSAGVCGLVVDENQCVVLNDVCDERDDIAARYLSFIPKQLSEMAVPLSVGARCFGVLNFENHRSHAFTAAHQEILRYLATGAAAGILVSERQVQFRCLTDDLSAALGRPDYVRESLLDAMRLAGAELAQVLEVDWEHNALRIVASTNPDDFVNPYVAIDKSVCGLVLNRRALQNIPDVRELEKLGLYERRLACDAVSELAVPVWVNGEIAQILNVESHRVGHFGPADEYLMQTLAGFAAIVASTEAVFDDALHELKRPVNHLAHQLDESFALTNIDRRLATMRRNVDELREAIGALSPRSLTIVASSLADILPQAIAGMDCEGIEVTTDLSKIDALPLVMLDRDAAKWIVRNVMDNAIYELRDGKRVAPRVKIRAVCDEQLVGLAIEDNGRGIAKALEEDGKLYQRFVSGKRASGGMGIGLAASRAWITRMGGELTHESNPGQGTVFYIRFRRSH